MKYNVNCPLCGEPSTMDKGDGYFYIAVSGCKHRSEIWKTCNRLGKLHMIHRRINKANDEKDRLEGLLIELHDQKRILLEEIEGPAGKKKRMEELKSMRLYNPKKSLQLNGNF